MGTREDDSDRSPTVDAADSGATGSHQGRRRRIDIMPGTGSARAEAINVGRHEMLTDTLRKQIKSLAERGVKRPRIGADAVC